MELAFLTYQMVSLCLFLWLFLPLRFINIYDEKWSWQPKFLTPNNLKKGRPLAVIVYIFTALQLNQSLPGHTSSLYGWVFYAMIATALAFSFGALVNFKPSPFFSRLYKSWRVTYIVVGLLSLLVLSGPLPPRFGLILLPAVLLSVGTSLLIISCLINISNCWQSGTTHTARTLDYLLVIRRAEGMVLIGMVGFTVLQIGSQIWAWIPELSQATVISSIFLMPAILYEATAFSLHNRIVKSLKSEE